MSIAPIAGGGSVLELVGGPYVPLRGYVGVPSPFTDVVDPDSDTLADPGGTIVSERILVNPNLIAGLSPFFVVDAEVSRAGVSTSSAMGWGSTPWGALSLLSSSEADTGTVRVSDIGYRTESPVIPYPPLLMDGFSVDARIPLSPAQTGIVYGYGSLSIVNAGRQYDALVNVWNMDARRITIKYGVKIWDDTRGVFIDPISDDLLTVFTGIGGQWELSEFTLDIPLRDASYWLDRPIQRAAYAGTGTYEGDAELKGTLKPKTRGVAFNVPLTLIDRVNYIYQYNDARGEVTTLYEGAATTITFQANTTDLYSGSTDPGKYRTDNSRGLLQLGSSPADNAAITADVIGHFPSAAAQTIAANIVRFMLIEDIGLPSDYMDVDTFTTAATDYPYQAGWYWGPNDQIDGATAVGVCLASFGARVVPATSGELKCFVLQAVGISESPVASFGPAQILESGVKPRPMAADINPPTWRVRCAYQHNYTIQNSGILGSASDTRRQFVQTADRFAVWSNEGISDAYANANDLPPFGGGLTSEADAQEVADRTGALFGTRRYVFDVPLPLVEAVAIEFGDVVTITYPNHALAHGARGRVVGRSFNAADLSMTLTVMI